MTSTQQPPGTLLTPALAQSPDFPELATKAIKTLEKLLSDTSIPAMERASLAAQVLELQQSEENKDSTHSDSKRVNLHRLQLSDGWKKWVVENKLRGVPDAVLVETMINDGIAPEIALEAVSILGKDSDFQIESDNTQRLKKLESIMAIRQQVASLSSHHGQIERKGRLSQEEFLENYYSTNTPVIMTDMMSDWPALHSWNPNYLKSKYGNASVEVQFGRESDPNYEINLEKHRKKISLREYTDLVEKSGSTNDFYMVANNGNLENKELKGLYEDFEMPESLLNMEKRKERVFFWFGPKGTVTPIHHDPMNVMMAHVYGRKRWRLMAPDSTPLIYNDVGVFSRVDLENPDYDKYPMFKDINIIEEVLSPGEIIFVPVGWWHQVKALDISISLSFTNFVFPNDYAFKNPQINRDQVN